MLFSDGVSRLLAMIWSKNIGDTGKSMKKHHNGSSMSIYTKGFSTTASSPELQRQLLDSKLDLALLTCPSNLPSLVYEPFGREKVVALFSRVIH